MSPPGKVKPPGRATGGRDVHLAGRRSQTDYPTTGRQNPVADEDAPTLFGAVVVNGAYGRTTTFDVPSYARGPARRTTTGPSDASAPEWWWAEAEQVVMDIITTNGTVTSDDLHEHYADEPSATGAAFGGLFSRMANAGQIVEVGMTKSRRPEARRRRIILWAAP